MRIMHEGGNSKDGWGGEASVWNNVGREKK